MADTPKLTALGKIFIFLFIAACIGMAAYRFGGASWFQSKTASTGTSGGGGGGGLFGSGASAEIGIAYGTEKERWLQWAAAEFAKTNEGKNIKINMIPMGSLEGARAVLANDQRITAWSPASSIYKDVFLEEWKVKHGDENPIAKEDQLALSPMVFVMWKERYDAFVQKYKTLSFATISQALQEKSGWESIAQKPEWGFFKFGHTHPNQSSSGLMTLILAAYSYDKKTNHLQLSDIVDGGFQDFLQKMERGVTGMSNSTGNMMREMVLKGPSSFDVLFVYESVTIDYLKNAEGRWGQIHVSYPEYNAWNENPYYILNVPWSSKEQRAAADAFLAFLLSERVQKESLVHGFRPANSNVAIKFADSPFVKYANYGVQVDLQKMCEPPKAEVVNNLLASWQRSQGDR